MPKRGSVGGLATLMCAVRAEFDAADELVEIGRQLVVDPALDVSLEEVAEADTGDGKRRDDRDRRGDQQPEADRVAGHAVGSGIRYPKPRRVSIASEPSLRRSRATITSMALVSRSLSKSYRCSASSVGGTTRPAWCMR